MPCPRRSTTPHVVRGCTGPGGTRRTARPSSGTTHTPAGALPAVRGGAQREAATCLGAAGATGTGSAAHRGADHRVLRTRADDRRCRRWCSCRKSSHCLLLPSRLSKCPRSLLRTPSRSERLRSWRNSWLKCRCLPSATVSSSRRCAVTALGCRWLRMVPLLGTRGALLVAVWHTACPVDPPGGTHRQPGRYVNTGQG